MDKELIIQSGNEGIEIALTEDKKLVELHYDNSGGEFNVGDLYLGQVRKVASGLNAVFVNIGHKKDAFLHYTDLSPNYKSLQKFTDHARKYEKFSWDKFKPEDEIQKAGKINDVISTKQKILVQVLKEPISTKGPRISCEVSLPGRFIVLVPFIDQVNVSKKIESREERHRLKSIITNIKEAHYGVIVRTAAKGRSTAELHQDLTALAESWKSIQHNLYKADAPKKILSEQNKTTSLLRDLLSDDFNKIVTNDENVLAQTKEYIQKIAPGKESIVTLHKNGKAIFDHFGINHQVKSAFGKTVMMEGGGYLVIEHTEALHVVDVNSGHKFSADNQEATALNTNLSAVKELARQLRLRDIGGIIIVDFIDMRSADNRRAVSDAMQAAMKDDRARHSILGISRFGLLQITRQRLRPAIKIATGEQCPSCEGTGKVRSTHVLVEDLEKHIKYLTRQSSDTIELKVHPIVFSHLTKKAGLFKPSIFQKWKKNYGKFLCESDSNLGFLDYKFFVKETGEEIKF